jgi:hypothetical protein
VALPDLGAGTLILNDIHAFSERDIWAVGQRVLPGGEHIVTVAIRWDGTTWKPVPTPDDPSIPRAKSHLYAVGGTASDDIWAAGARAEDGVHYTGLALHWDGTEWREYETPNPGALDNTISAVSAVAPDDVWAVGSYVADEHEEARMLAIHWDGSRWTQADLSHVSTHSLLAVAAPKRSTVWAAGTEILRWDGRTWSIEPIPVEVSGTYFDDIAASDDGNMAWAVGNDGNEAVAIFWNGARWSGETLPKLADGPYPHDLAILSPTEVWAVGEYSSAPSDRRLLLHRWDGTRWHAIPNPLPARNTRLLSITRAGDNLWAAGAQGGDEESRGLVMKHTQDSCK